MHSPSLFWQLVPHFHQIHVHVSTVFSYLRISPTSICVFLVMECTGCHHPFDTRTSIFKSDWTKCIKSALTKALLPFLHILVYFLVPYCITCPWDFSFFQKKKTCKELSSFWTSFFWVCRKWEISWSLSSFLIIWSVDATLLLL